MDCAGSHMATIRLTSLSLIARSIETKAEDGEPNDAIRQICIWFAAYHKRMYYVRNNWDIFRKRRVLATTDYRLVTVPLINVVGPIWNFYFSYGLKTRIHIYGPLIIGSMADLALAYALFTSLVAIREATEVTYLEATKKWFVCEY